MLDSENIGRAPYQYHDYAVDASWPNDILQMIEISILKIFSYNHHNITYNLSLILSSFCFFLS